MLGRTRGNVTQQQAEGAWRRQETASVHVSQDYKEDNSFPAPNPKAERLPLWSDPRGARAPSHVAMSLFPPNPLILLCTGEAMATPVCVGRGYPYLPQLLLKSLVAGRVWVPESKRGIEREGGGGTDPGWGHTRRDGSFPEELETGALRLHFSNGPTLKTSLRIQK